jgi:hypothetical protein
MPIRILTEFNRMIGNQSECGFVGQEQELHRILRRGHCSLSYRVKLDPCKSFRNQTEFADQ